MASKKKVSVKKVKDAEESNPVVPVVFRRSFTGYPKAGSFGYIDADLFPIWEAKGHVYRFVEVLESPEVLEEVEVDDEINSEGEPGAVESRDHATVYGEAGD